MKMIETLHHPKETFWKTLFLRLSILRFLALPALNIFFSHEVFPLAAQYSNHVVIAILLIIPEYTLIIYFLNRHAIGQNRNGLLTFIFVIDCLNLLMTLLLWGLYFADKLHPQFQSVLVPNSSFLTNLIFAISIIWMFVAFKVRQINQINRVRESIETSPEAMQLLANLETPESQASVEQFINYLLFRLPPSLHKLVKPLEIEALKRLPSPL
ncbi:MAG: hypothetical protein ACOYK9_04295 [Chlamydiia bacterium]